MSIPFRPSGSLFFPVMRGTPLLHKGVVKSAAYHHKKVVSAMIPFKGHYWVDPVDHIDLTAVPLWLRV